MSYGYIQSPFQCRLHSGHRRHRDFEVDHRILQQHDRLDLPDPVSDHLLDGDPVLPDAALQREGDHWDADRRVCGVSISSRNGYMCDAALPSAICSG